MAKTEVHLQGALEPLILDEPMNATAMNMSAASNASVRFFQGKDEEDHMVVIAIPNVNFMREIDD